MEVRIPRPGDIYRHFKGNVYEIVIIARDSETLEEKVVYKEVGGDAAYVRTLPMFVSPVDKAKYPDAVQEYRFEYIGNDSEEETAQLENAELIMGFLEQDTVREKLNFLTRVKDEISDNFLEIVAQSLDFVESETNLSARYESILQYLRMVEKYEKERLR